MNKISRANVSQIRQETQYTCVAASIASCLKAHGKSVTEQDVNHVLGASPLSGASWEQALATLQYFGMRGHLVVPSTIDMLRYWTDAGTPVCIAWTPRDRPWSHASVVYHVDDEHVHVMDPNLPDPSQTTIAVSHEDFYAKWFEKYTDNVLIRRPALAIEREVFPDGRQVRASVADVTTQPLRTQPDYGTRNAPDPGAETSMTTKNTKNATRLLSAAEYSALLDEKESKFERGEDVPLEKLPEELQENVKNPPESVKQVTEDMKKASCGCGGACTCGAKSAGSLTFADYASELGLGDKEAKFERGKSMTIDEVAKVVGPEFKEMNENPPESVVKVREEMVAGKTAAGRETHIANPDKHGFNLCGERSYPDAMADSPSRATCFYCKSAWQKAHGGHTAGAGLYGVTKDIESVSLAGVRRLQAAVNRLAKEIYARDEETPTFLQEHSKRSGSRAARLLIGAMKDLGPGAALSRVAGGKAGLYGYKERTAKIALAACSDLYHEAGLIAGELHGRRAAHHERVTGFLKEHSKAARCQYASMLLEAYPSAPRTASEGTHLVEVLTNPREASEPSVQEILNQDRIARVAADFLAGATVTEDEEGASKEASVGSSMARMVNNRLMNLAEVEVMPDMYVINLDGLVDLLKKVMRYPAAEVTEFQTTLQALMKARLKTVL